MTFVDEYFPGKSSIPLFAFSSISLYVASVIIYRLFFHPLRDYPAPFWARVSDVPFILSRSFGKQHWWTEKVHKRYGPVVRLAPWYISYTLPGAWKDISGPKTNVGGVERGGIPRDFSGAIGAMGGTNSLVWASDSDHPRLRRIMSAAFSDKARGEQEPIIRRYIDLMISKLAEKIRASENGTGIDDEARGATVNLVDWISFTTFDIMHDLTFGTDLGMTVSGAWTPWMAGIFTSLKDGTVMTALIATFPMLTPLFLFFTPQSIVDAVTAHTQASEEGMKRRVDMDTERPDFWTCVQRALKRFKDAGDTEMTIKPKEVDAFGKTLIIAGTETSATVISGLAYLLSTNHGAHEKLVGEIRNHVKDPSEVDMAKIATLPWLNACLNESLRLYPPALGMPRIVPGGGRIICDRFVPGGTSVHVPHYISYRTETNFALPTEFRPERWIPEDPGYAIFRNDQREVFQPFSVGPRNCIGKSFAYNEARLLVFLLYWHFDIHTTAENKDWLMQRNYLVFEKKPLFARLTLASHSNVK